jgi:hypothetical protein
VQAGEGLQTVDGVTPFLGRGGNIWQTSQRWGMVEALSLLCARSGAPLCSSLDDWAQLDAWDRQTLCKITESFLACMADETVRGEPVCEENPC